MELRSNGQGQRQMGGDLNGKAIRKLSGAPTPEDIFDNMDSFNEEITESHSEFIGGPEIIIDPKVQVQAPVKRNLSGPRSQKLVTQAKPAVKITPRKEVEVMPREKVSTLESDLDNLVAEATPQEAPVDDSGISRSRVMTALSKLQGAPSERQVEAWKREYGEDGVHVTVFSEKEIYVYTHLTRAGYSKVRETMDKLNKVKEGNVSEADLMDKVVQHAMLFPKLDERWKYNSRAGVLEALYTAIMAQSYFLNPQQVMSLTMEL